MIEAILIGLSGWRIASLLVDESGPFDVFEKLRNLIGLKPGEISGFFPSLFSCIMCMTVWTCLLTYGLYQIEPIIVMVIASMTIALAADKAVR